MTRVAIVAGMRTPFVKAGGAFKDFTPLQLSSHAVKGVLDRLALDPAKVDQLVWGRVLHDPFVSNPAREIVFDLGLPPSIPAYLVSNNCTSSIHAAADVADAIAVGRIEIGIAGGVEAMSSVPVLFGKEASGIFLQAATARSKKDRLRTLLKLRPKHFLPVPLAFKEPSTGLSMGEHAEISAKEWGITREEQDDIALRSHLRASEATRDGRLTAEIAPLKGIAQDTIIRHDASREKMATLRPVFDRSGEGTITAANSSPLTDGAAAVVLMSEERAKAEGYEPLAFVKAVEFAALDPKDGLLMAPALAVPRLLGRTGLTLAEMDFVEIHEAFGAQVAFNLAAWKKGWKEEAIGEIPPEKLNPLGSSIAVGHPFAATGARILTTAAYEMKRRGARYALISVCAAGAMAAAVILERP